ncbi:MAG TPA: site-specific integrase [Armatimonadota bacterium]
MDVWLSHIRGGVEDSTFASYETIIRGHISAKHIVVKGTKTRRVRVVTLNDSLVTVLNHHRETTVHRQPDDWICGEEDGQHVNPHHLTIYFARLMRELGLKLTLHGLRHTHASALLAAGIPVKVISERLGHASVTLTQDIYAHVLPTMQREAAEKMEAIWGGALNAVPTNERNKRKGNSRLVCTFRSKS